ncbi:MAG: XRE family transcriptional regulator [Caldilinea sp. CFX5]|nr:XRE family transcriptional regulator [Caldilinea sp. CFX5]
MASPSTTTFGTLLRQLRRRAQMTQSDLAAAVGYSVSFISSLEQNTRRPDVHSVLQHFVPALALQEETHLATHLLELAAAAQGDLPPADTLTLTHERRIVITATNPVPSTNLPTPPTPLIGRDQTVQMLSDRLLGHQGRLLTLVGPPGVGKTRLAMAVAAHLQAFHPDGVYFVPLAPVSDPDLVASAIAAALGLLETNPHSLQSRLLAFLRHKALLLLLDNFEQVVAAAPLVAELLAACPRLRMLTTSRERLHLRAEQRFLVPPLEIAPACTLFVQRTQAVDPDFTLTAQNQAVISVICQGLDGLPLAIELAAAQMALFSPQTLLERLASQRLDLLNNGPADLPPRHRHLRTVFDHSWQLLNAAERLLLAQLAVFRGGFTVQAMEAVTGAPAPVLLALVVKSLVRRQLQERLGAERCDLHELIRQYAADHLTQMAPLDALTRQRHSRFYCRLLAEQEPKLHGAEQQAALALIALELDNIRAAWHWAVAQQQIELLGPAMHSLGLFYEWRNHYQEGEAVYKSTVQALQTMTQSSSLVQPVLAEALAWQGAFTRIAGRLAEVGELLEASLAALAQVPPSRGNIQCQRAFTLLQMGYLAEVQVMVAPGAEHYQQALALYQLLGDGWGEARVQLGLGEMIFLTGNYAQARPHYEASLALFQAAADQRGQASVLDRLGCVLRDQGELQAAEPLIMQAVAIYEALGDRAKIARGQHLLGGLAMYAGNFRAAYPMIRKSVDLYEELGLPGPYHAIGIIHMEQGEYAAARTTLEAYIAHQRRSGNQSLLAFGLQILACLANTETQYGEAEQLATESFTLCQQTQEIERGIIATAHLGYAARGLGRPAMAQQCFLTVLEWAVVHHGAVPLFFGLAGMALLLADQGQVERAVELYAHLADLPMVVTSQSRWDLVGKPIAACAAALPPAVADAAHARGKAGDLWATAAALLLEFNGQPAPLTSPSACAA